MSFSENFATGFRPSEMRIRWNALINESFSRVTQELAAHMLFSMYDRIECSLQPYNERNAVIWKWKKKKNNILPFSLVQNFTMKSLLCSEAAVKCFWHARNAVTRTAMFLVIYWSFAWDALIWLSHDGFFGNFSKKQNAHHKRSLTPYILSDALGSQESSVDEGLFSAMQ